MLSLANEMGLAPDAAKAAALAVFREEGLGKLSIRAVAERAEVPAATIQRRFGAKQQLLRDAVMGFVFEDLAHLRRLLAGLGRGLAPRALGDVLCAAIAEREPRSHAMLIEMLAAAARDPALCAAATAWVEQSDRLWGELADDGRGGGIGPFLTELYVGLALDSLGGEPALRPQLVNAEVARLALSGASGLEPLWFARFLADIAEADGARLSVSQSDDLKRFLDAGAELVAMGGVEAISFRSVAARAGRSFSAAASLFRKKETLVSLIYLHMANTAVRAAPRPLRMPRSGEETGAILTDMMLSEGMFSDEYYLQSRAELALMAARDPQFADLAWRMRMVGGLYEIRKDDPTFDPYGLFAFSVHARACWATGVAMTRMAISAPENRRAVLLRRFNADIHRFSLQ